MIMALLTSLTLNAYANSPSNQIGWKLYQSRDSSTINLNISPASIYAALSLTFEGAEGEARHKAQQFLGLPEGKGPLKPQILEALHELEKNEQIKFTMANSIWLDQSSSNIKSPHEDYKKIIGKMYAAEVKKLAFKPYETTAKKINTWIEAKTADKIKDMIKPVNLENTNIAIVNAIYFKGDWQTPFKAESTRNDDFNGKIKKQSVPFMSNMDRFKYFENDEVAVTEMPYMGNDTAMTLILPKKKSLEELQKHWSSDQLDTLFSKTKEELVWIQLPKFELAGDTMDLTKSLLDIGMPDHGKFSRMGVPDFRIQSVLHKTWLKVDEKGTEAAAATAVMARAGSAPPQPKIFKADKPFLFVIRELKSGNWLFVGRVDQP